MEKQWYKITDKDGNTRICKKDNDRYLEIRELAQFIALDIVDDYNDIVAGNKTLSETNMTLAINVLDAISKVM